MSVIKDLIKKHKQLEIEIKKITKTRLNDRTSRLLEILEGFKKIKVTIKR